MFKMTARQRVLSYLRKQQVASAEQIGFGLDMSAASVRHHLSILLADGRIILVGEKRKGMRGRPVNLYGLSEKSLGDNYPILTSAILEALLEDRSSATREQIINAIARKIALAFGDEEALKALAAKRLAMLVDKLNEMHYRVHWEAGAQGPRILFAHCPYAAIIEKHPELCRMDAALLAELTGVAIHQLAKIGVQPVGSPYCIFQAG